MSAKYIGTALLLASSLLFGCAVPNKVVVSNSFMSEDKTSKFLLLDTGQINPANKQKLYNVIVRICNIDAQGNETECKDNAVIDNVVPGSVS